MIRAADQADPKMVAGASCSAGLVPTALMWWFFHHDMGLELLPVLAIVFAVIAVLVPVMYYWDLQHVPAAATSRLPAANVTYG